MPYITDHEKASLVGDIEAQLSSAHFDLPATPGQLTWMLMTWVAAYFEQQGVSYRTITEVKGALEGLRSDIDRRIAWPYEQKKQNENGEAWPDSVLSEVLRVRE